MEYVALVLVVLVAVVAYRRLAALTARIDALESRHDVLVLQFSDFLVKQAEEAEAKRKETEARAEQLKVDLGKRLVKIGRGRRALLERLAARMAKK
jgi:hypothetical protein